MISFSWSSVKISPFGLSNEFKDNSAFVFLHSFFFFNPSCWILLVLADYPAFAFQTLFFISDLKLCWLPWLLGHLSIFNKHPISSLWNNALFLTGVLWDSAILNFLFKKSQPAVPSFQLKYFFSWHLLYYFS